MTHIQISNSLFVAKLRKGLERRIMQYEQYVNGCSGPDERPLRTPAEWMSEYKRFSEQGQDTDLNELIKAFLSAGE